MQILNIVQNVSAFSIIASVICINVVGITAIVTYLSGRKSRQLQ